MTTLGIIGAGNIGSHVARKAIDNGYEFKQPELAGALANLLG